MTITIIINCNKAKKNTFECINVGKLKIHEVKHADTLLLSKRVPENPKKIGASSLQLFKEYVL